MTPEQTIELAKKAGFLIDEAPISQPYVIQATRYKIDDEIQRFYELLLRCDRRGDAGAMGARLPEPDDT